MNVLLLLFYLISFSVLSLIKSGSSHIAKMECLRASVLARITHPTAIDIVGGVLLMVLVMGIICRCRRIVARHFLRLSRICGLMEAREFRNLILILCTNWLFYWLSFCFFSEASDNLKILPFFKSINVILLSILALKMFDAFCRVVTAKFDFKQRQIFQMLLVLKVIARCLILLIGCLFLIKTFGYSISQLCAAVGFGGALLAFLAKEAIGNVLSCLTLVVDRPFQIGDLIRIPDRNIEGIVEIIGLRSTKIRTQKSTLLIIPNSLLTDVPIDNLSKIERLAQFDQ